MIDPEYLTQVETRLEAIERELAQPGVASKKDLYRELLTEHAHLSHLHECAATYFGLLHNQDSNQSLINDSTTDTELRALAESEQIDIKNQIVDAEKDLGYALLPPNPDDSRNVIVEIRAGTGGEEAGLFAGDLYRMYMRFAERQSWKSSAIDANPTNIGGFKEIVCSIEGKDVYRFMQYESGVHRVQRIPATEASGRIHTSAATVVVLPEVEEAGEVEIRSDELRIDTYRASGAGGQHVNKTDSAVRITHFPSGLVVQSQDERSQHRNRDKAMRVLRARLFDLQRQEESAKIADARRILVGSGDRSERIRTYNFPQNRLTDHRINLTLYSLDKIMQGELGELVNRIHEKDMERMLKKRLGEETVKTERKM